ncbi:hypothetical protein E2C01_009712 [Portunus trituberculatus]|uniref:Uncharacterized protein n=1 Tax=Portunus trituberculatus TaxID=210409 RepID=A0A5B7D6I0_PORTR|nr:hypothetical protein [Portunus trituberculatus]
MEVLVWRSLYCGITLQLELTLLTEEPKYKCLLVGEEISNLESFQWSFEKQKAHLKVNKASWIWTFVVLCLHEQTQQLEHEQHVDFSSSLRLPEHSEVQESYN